MVNIDALYRRARRSVIAPDWVKPYLAVHPSEARRMLKSAFFEGVLAREEESAIRSFIDELALADETSTAYPTWNEFVRQEFERPEMSEDEWCEAVGNSGFPEKNNNGKKDGK
ncbi:hypothetical protein [Microbacterium sp. HMWF026]|uniref:hypothetical protein n=1 Tax=Microbacterium sp. HMWF026 TaxID=2056861 RepID=UPI0011B1F43D|nr:hypothetical protein [Microbacterium sp. HMWF026]